MIYIVDFKILILRTISTFHQFDKLLIDIDYMFEDQKSYIESLVKYHDFYIDLSAKHFHDLSQLFSINGYANLDSSISFLKSSKLDYEIVLDNSNKLLSHLNFKMNNKDIINANVNGSAAWNEIGIDFNTIMNIKEHHLNYDGNQEQKKRDTGSQGLEWVSISRQVRRAAF